MATTARRTVTIDELADVLKRLNQEPVSPKVLGQRRELSAEIRRIRAETEPMLDEDIKEVIRKLRGDRPVG